MFFSIMEDINGDNIDILVYHAMEHGEPKPLDGGVEYILKLQEEPPRKRNVVITCWKSDDIFDWFLRCDIYGKDPDKNCIGAIFNGSNIKGTKCYHVVNRSVNMGGIESFNSVVSELVVAIEDAYHDGEYSPLQFNNPR